MSTNKATVLDSLPARFVKDSACVTAKIITHIVNLSITCGTFPKDLKTAWMVPLHKKSSKNKCRKLQACVNPQHLIQSC